MTAMDPFARFVVAVPIKSMEAQTVAKCFFYHVILRLGAPIKILSDNGSQFQCTLFKDICRLIEIKQLKTSPYYPMTKGQIEKLHFSLNGMLAKTIKSSQKNWCDYIPLISPAYNTSEHAIAKQTSNFLNYGRQLKMPIDLFGCAPSERYESTSDYALALVERLQQAYDEVREITERTAERRRVKHDFGLKFPQFENYSLVWHYTPRRPQDCPPNCVLTGMVLSKLFAALGKRIILLKTKNVTSK